MTKDLVESLGEKGYHQVCIWEGCLVYEEGSDLCRFKNLEEAVKEFEGFFQEELKVRIKYLEEVKTKPDSTGPGGRNDVFFIIHDEDVDKFAIPRLQYGIRWYEDVVKYNKGSKRYPEEIIEKYKVRW